jgi:hypothetical protein
MDQKFVFQEYIGIRNCPYLKRIFRNKKENKMLGKQLIGVLFLISFLKEWILYHRPLDLMHTCES